MIRSRAPVRISLGGGGTDVSPYMERHGGIVLSTTIDRYAYCTVDESSKWIFESKFAEMAARPFMHLSPASVAHFTEAPAGSGLGGSSSLMVAIIKAFDAHFNGGEFLSPHQIAEQAYKVERKDLGIVGGWQDQFAAAYGGWNLLDFSKDGTKVIRLDISEDTKRELLASLILVDLGQTRLSSKILSRQIATYNQERPEAMEALNKVKEITRQMVVRLLVGDIEGLGLFLSEEWNEKKKLDSQISNHSIDKFHAGMLKRGAIGGKLLGAGSGGHMVFIADLSERKSLLTHVEDTGFKHIPFNFDSQGVVAWKT